MKSIYQDLAVTVCALVASTLGAQAGWFSDETPPANAKPLSSTIKAVEDRGLKTITEIEFEDGKWRSKSIRPTARRPRFTSTRSAARSCRSSRPPWEVPFRSSSPPFNLT
jgi:hypothetical protein